MDFAGEKTPQFCDKRGNTQVVSKAGFKAGAEYVNIELKCTHKYVEIIWI